MKILIISDTHGNVNRAFIAHSRCEPVDAVIHLGDGCADAELLREVLDIPVLNVAGNCDPGSGAPRERVWECEGKLVLLTHGDAYQVKSGLDRLRLRAKEIGADAVFFGHTHLSLLENNSGILFLNPGTLANHGHHRSYAVIDITSEGIDCRHFSID